MQPYNECLNIGIVILSEDLRVIGMNDFAKKVLGMDTGKLGKSVFHYHHRKSQEKIKAILGELSSSSRDIPVAMIIDVLNKVLMINVGRLDMKGFAADSLLAMTFVDVTERAGAKVNPGSGMVELKRFPVYHKGSCLFIEASSIYFVRSDGNYCEIFTSEHSFYIHLNLKGILQRYTGSSFFRVHKSYVVNLDHVKELRRGEGGQAAVVFDSNQVAAVPVSRRKIRELKEALSGF